MTMGLMRRLWDDAVRDGENDGDGEDGEDVMEMRLRPMEKFCAEWQRATTH